MDQSSQQTERMKYCKHCGARIPEDAVICTSCGRQVETVRNESQPNVVIQNTNTNVNTGGRYGRPKNKWVAFFLCLFLGFIGAHKFYEEKTGMGILYLFTAGLFMIGSVVDLIALLFKPNPYYV